MAGEQRIQWRRYPNGERPHGDDPLDIGHDHAQYTPDRSPFGRPPREPLVSRTFPVSQTLPDYQKEVAVALVRANADEIFRGKPPASG